MCYCYILKCNDNSYYAGSCRKIEVIIKDHNLGKVKYTKIRRPIKLMFLKKFNSYNEAYTFEQKVKSWKKRKSIERMFNKDDNLV